MKKLPLLLLLFLAMFCQKSEAAPKQFDAVITFFWKSEEGGKYNCDGERLKKGDAAVDFRIFPKNTIIHIEDKMTVVASDAGGSAVISRKAARARGLHCPIVDVWCSSKVEAMALELLVPKVATVTLSGPNLTILDRHHKYFVQN